MKSYVLILSVLTMFLLVGCYSPAKTVELGADNETVTDQVLNQLQNVAKEIEQTKNETTVEENLPVLKVNETELVNLKVDASDADNDKIKYTFSEPLDKSGEWQTDYGDAGEYTVTITASDGELSTSKKILLTVLKKNVAPVVEKLDGITVNEGETVKLEPAVTDVNKDEIKLTISDPVGDDGIWETGNKDAGEYKVKITASDGELSVDETVNIKVLDKNVAPAIEVPETVTISEGDTLKLEPVITDADEDKVTYTISEPVGDDGIWETGYTDNGEYEVTIKATDGKDETIAVVKVVVEDVNKAPEITDIKLG